VIIKFFTSFFQRPVERIVPGNNAARLVGIDVINIAVLERAAGECELFSSVVD